MSAPPRRILVATDLSEQAGSAVRRAGQLAAEHAAQLTAVHVLPAGLDAELTEFARRRVRSHIDRFAGPAMTEAVVRHGSVVREIVSTAAEYRADLVVVGAHGGHWLAGRLLGSTPQNLVRVSPEPVLVVKCESEGAYRTVVLAVDASDVARTAAHTACALTPHARHLVLHVAVVVGETLMEMHGVGEAQLAQLRATSTEQVRAEIEKLAVEMTPPAAQVLIESGRPHTRLPELSSQHAADLIALGTGGGPSLGYALLGSVAQHVLRDAPSDVLLVPGADG